MLTDEGEAIAHIHVGPIIHTPHPIQAREDTHSTHTHTEVTVTVLSHTVYTQPVILSITSMPHLIHILLVMITL